MNWEHLLFVPRSPNEGAGTDDTDFDIPEGEDLDTIEIPAEPKEGVAGTAPSSAPPVSPIASPSAAPSPSSGTAATAQPALQPAPAAPVAGGPQVQPQQPAPAQPTGQPSAGSQPAAPRNMEELWATNRQALEQHFASQILGLDDAAREEFNTSPETAIPKFGARVLFTALSSMHRQIQQTVPDMIMRGVSSFLEMKEKADTSQGKFFERWPQLKGRDDTILSYLRPYIAANPKATLEQRIEAVGLMASQALGLPLVTQPQTATVVKPRAAPFIPAGPSSAAPLPVETGNDPWAGFMATPDDGD